MEHNKNSFHPSYCVFTTPFSLFHLPEFEGRAPRRKSKRHFASTGVAETAQFR
jgi:hypothetical protein